MGAYTSKVDGEYVDKYYTKFSGELPSLVGKVVVITGTTSGITIYGQSNQLTSHYMDKLISRTYEFIS